MLVTVSNLLLQESYEREWKQIAFIARFLRYRHQLSIVNEEEESLFRRPPLFAVPRTCAFYQKFPFSSTSFQFCTNS